MNLELNNESWPVERAEISCVLGDTLNVGVTLFNALQLDMGPLNLQVSVFQDMQNGFWLILNLVPKPRTYFHVRLIDGVAKIFPTSYAWRKNSWER